MPSIISSQDSSDLLLSCCDMTVPVYLPNYGRPVGRPGPVGLWKYADPDVPLPVNLVVVPTPPRKHKRAPTQRNAHWMFTWDIGKTSSGHVAQRRLHVVRESLCGHLTNWGGLTVADDPAANPSRVTITVKTMTLPQRQTFENIANTTKVKHPESGWNGQDWCVEVLEAACREGLLDQVEVKKAIDEARGVEPLDDMQC